MIVKRALSVAVLCVCAACTTAVLAQETTPPNEASTQKPASPEISAQAQAPAPSENRKTQDAQPESAAPADLPKSDSATPVFSNESVLELTKMGMGSEVIIAKIDAAKQTSFKVEMNDLRSLKDADVSQEVIAAMVRRSAEPAAPQGGAAPATMMGSPMGAYSLGWGDLLVRLVTNESTTDLTSIGGHMGMVYAYFTMLTFMDYPNFRAEVRTRDRRPHIMVQSGRNPTGRVFLVHCDSDKGDNKRSVKVGQGGAFTSGGYGAPDSDDDWTVPVDVKQVEPGLWRLDPRVDLKPGEYGVWGPDSELYDFGVDKEPKTKK
jgi:hypothetical protein